jgi:hypothetical protein
MRVLDTFARRMPFRGRSAALVSLALAFLATISALAGPATTPQDAATLQQAAPFKAFLPSVITPGSTKQTTTPTPPAATKGGVFIQRDVETHSPAIAVDAAGGMHIAYIRYTAAINNPPAYYGYCPGPAAKCLDPAAWSLVMFQGQVERVELALTPAGKPRLLYLTDINGGLLYNYAECNGVCTDPSAWAVAGVAATADVDVTAADVAHREFAIDPQGRPRFIFYTDSSLYFKLPRTLYYMACETSCTNPRSWTATDLNPSNNNDIFSHPVLAFTPQGQPRVLTERVTGGGTPPSIHYMACDTNCTSVYNWALLPLLPRGNGTDPSWDLQIDAQGRTHAALLPGPYDNGGGGQLLYASCDAGCMDVNNWYAKALLPAGEGENPALKLDAQGRPRIAYKVSNGAGLGYLWCNDACTNDSAVWKTVLAEPSDLLDATFPLPVPPACDKSSWTAGGRLSFALDAAGNAYVGYLAQRLLRCYYSDPQSPGLPPTTNIEHLDYTRFSFFPQP